MKLAKAKAIIDTPHRDGYTISFMCKDPYGKPIYLRTPETYSGELPFATAEIAWDFAEKFSEKTFGIYQNICVIDMYGRPVSDRIIINCRTDI